MKVLFRGYHTTGTADFPTCIYTSFVNFTCDIKNLKLTSSFPFVHTSHDEYFINYFDETRRVQVHHLPIEATVRQISGGNNEVIVLTENGELLRLTHAERYAFKLIPRFTPNDDKVVKIACGARIQVALTQTGKLFNAGHKLNFEHKRVKHLAAGREHCVVLDDDGNVYTFGSGSRGQLGHGDLESRVEPVLVDGLVGIKIIAVAAGGWHSCVVSQDGDLYAWGWNGNGQLGIGDSFSVMASPHVVDFGDYDNQIDVVRVACGARHTVVLLSNGRLYGCGWNKYRQVCDSDTENIYQMSFCYDFDDENVAEVCCGPWSTAVVICLDK